MQDEPEDKSETRRDGELLRRYAQAGDQAAFAEIGRRYAGLVYATCLRETGERTLAEDAAQDVFLLLCRKAGALQRSESIAGWLYTASRYVCKNRMKQERRRRMNEAQAAESLEAIKAIEDAEKDANASWERVEPHLHDALDRLKGEDREAVLLRFVAEQSFSEVGRRLGLSENTARMRVNRAVEKIRAHLGKAGVAVSLGILTLLLEERAAQAAPARLLHALPQIGAGNITASGPAAHAPGSILPRAGLRAILSSGHLSAGIGALLIVFVGIVFSIVVYRQTLPQRLSETEQRRLFTRMAGRWTGTLEYADDRTLQHSTYATTVTIRLLNGGSDLEYTAAYTGTPSVDVTTFHRDKNSGQTVVQNGGMVASHRLYAMGELTRLRPGKFAFAGYNVALNADTRLLITLKGSQLSMQEEYRKIGQADYQFRNRFALSRQ